jgi:hypothetical protein
MFSSRILEIQQSVGRELEQEHAKLKAYEGRYCKLTHGKGVIRNEAKYSATRVDRRRGVGRGPAFEHIRSLRVDGGTVIEHGE